MNQERCRFTCMGKELSRHMKVSPAFLALSLHSFLAWWEESYPVSVAQAVCGLEVGAAGEFEGLQEMQQRPQFLDAVLEGCASHKELVAEVPLGELLHIACFKVSEISAWLAIAASGLTRLPHGGSSAFTLWMSLWGTAPWLQCCALPASLDRHKSQGCLYPKLKQKPSKDAPCSEFNLAQWVTVYILPNWHAS